MLSKDGKLRVCAEPCDQCPFNGSKIVSAARKREIVRDLKRKQSYFICHKHINGDRRICKGFYDKLGYVSQLVRIAERLGVLAFVGDETPAE